jgi:hypothetical protein
MPKSDERVEALRQQVVKLRDEGLPFSKVGQKLGISKAYAVKLANAPDPPTPPRPETTRPTALTVRQRRFAAGLLDRKSQRQAAIDAGVSPGGADAYAQRTLNDLHFRGELREILNRAGLSLEEIARALGQSLQATKVVAYATKDGQITDVLEKPDHAVRQRAVRDAWPLHGLPDEATQQKSHGSIILHLKPEDRIMIENLRGSPLPPECFIEVDPEDVETTADAGTAPAVSTAVTPSDSRMGQQPESSPEVPPLPRDTEQLNVDQAVELARRRGEPEKTINMLASMKPYGPVISGAMFKQLCDTPPAVD